MKKVVRDIKRGVNKKVLKVPGIEQKVLDATSNKGWGPHALVLSDIALASRNYHEYQIIMAVIWKRINDTGKNWRHVYKALTVLEYLVANGSESVVYDIRERAYQISTLSDFQYTDSSGRDQGLNVRRKSQNLVALVNDKELISEVRQKAAANKDKYGSASPVSGSNRPGSYGDTYDAYDGRYGSKDERAYGRERETGYRSDDQNSRNGDSQSYDGDWNTANHGERNGRDGNRPEDHQYDSRSRSSDTDSQHSSQGMARRFSEQNLGAPPSYEEAVTETQMPEHGERDSETQLTFAPTRLSPPISKRGSSQKDGPDLSASHVKQDFDCYDEFDPRGLVQGSTTVPTAASNPEVDLLGSSDPFDSNPLAITQATSTTTAPEPVESATSGMGLTFGEAVPASNSAGQSFDDPFGDSPFKALPSSGSAPTASPFEVAMTNESNNHHHHMSGHEGRVPNFDFGNYVPCDSQFTSHNQSNPDEEIDILADILPPTGPPPVSAPHASFLAPPGHSSQLSDHLYGDFSFQGGNPSPFSALGGLPHQTNDGSHGDYSSQAQTVASPFSSRSSPPAQSSDHFNADFYSEASPFSAPHDQSTKGFGDFGALAVVEAQNGAQLKQGSFQQTGTPPSPFDVPSSDPPHPSSNYGDFGSEAGLETPVSSQMLPQVQYGMDMHFSHASGTSLPISAPSVQPPQMPLTKAQNATDVQFNQGNLQHGSETSLPFPAPTAQPPQILPQSQNGMLMQFNQGNFQNGLGTSLPQLQNGTELSLNHGQPKNQAGSPAFSAPSGQPQPYPTTGTPQHPFLPLTSQRQDSNPNMLGNLGSQAGSAISQALHINVQPQSQNTQVHPQYVSTAPPTSQLTTRGIQSAGGSLPHMSSHMANASIRKTSSGDFTQQQGQQAPFQTNDLFGDWAPHSGQCPPMSSQVTVSSSSEPLATVPQASHRKFETKSTVWTDTLSRGLVDLNISGPKTNPLSDIGIDFDTMNRKEKRMEKPKPTPAVSTITMGKAMGSGTGMGRAGASALRPASNPGSMGQSPGMGMMGGYGSMNPQNMGMGMNQGYTNMGMNQGYTNMGMNQGYTNMGMNPNMGMGMRQGYNPMQQPGGQNMPTRYNL